MSVQSRYFMDIRMEAGIRELSADMREWIWLYESITPTYENGSGYSRIEHFHARMDSAIREWNTSIRE